MLYLLIPLAVFALLGLYSWATWTTEPAKRDHIGGLDDLDPILSVLMTAGYGEPALVIMPGRADGYFRMTFPGQLVRLEVPLLASLPEGRRERYLAVPNDLGLAPLVAKSNCDQNDLVCEIEGPVDSVARVVKEAFVRLIDPEPGRAIDFQIFAHHWDQSIITRALTAKPPGDKPNQPVAMTRGRRPEEVQGARSGCLNGLVQLLLLPIPFMIAYLQYGVVAASGVLIAIFLVRETYRRWKRLNVGFQLRDGMKIIVVGLTGATVYWGDPLYLQLIPIVVLSAIAIAQLVVVVFGLPPIFPNDDAESSKAAKWLLTFAIVATGIFGALFYEHLRTCCSLDTWMWFFAFARLELLLGLVTAAMPFLFHQVFREYETWGDSDGG